ncbi:MAG: cytochrome c3 family protein [Planctomycetales bacterium]|nr:cytochrome c3 family protein [Planctomycetales bacterium]
MVGELRTQWFLWMVVSVSLAVFLASSLMSGPGAIRRTFLSGATTAGHYQIELRCDVCHTPGMGVRQESCIECHAQELEEANDTHPKSKFADPANAALLEIIDATRCTTCHAEHTPERTTAMGVSLPRDYCFRCHHDVAEVRPSHAEMEFESCASAGCHNFHDNRALYENFLASHSNEPPLLDSRTNLLRKSAGGEKTEGEQLRRIDADGPQSSDLEIAIVADWERSAHALGGVNCSNCHVSATAEWNDHVDYESCRACHEAETKGFLQGRHGMRLAQGLPPMSPELARLPMRPDAAHRELNCGACHGVHRFDTARAAVEACLECHADSHSLNYLESPHFALWQAERSGNAPPGTGVSCATCHLPRVEDADHPGQTRVIHNQNDNLRPNEKMLRSVCGNCHGLQFSLDSLADAALVGSNFIGAPRGRVESIEMAVKWMNRRTAPAKGGETK